MKAIILLSNVHNSTQVIGQQLATSTVLIVEVIMHYLGTLSSIKISLK